MVKIDIDPVCDTNAVTQYLNDKIDEGGGGIGVSKKYVDKQDAELQKKIDAEATARTEADIATNKRIDDIVPIDTSEFATKEELDTEYIESDPYPNLKNEDGTPNDVLYPPLNKDGTPKYKLMLDVHLTGLQNQIFTSQKEIDVLEAEDVLLKERIKALEDAGGGTGAVSGSGAKTIVLETQPQKEDVLDIPITKEDYENNKDFIIDENGVSYFAKSNVWHIVIPISMDGMTVASSKILRFRRLHGVNMEYYGIPPLLVEGISVKTPNSVRISIASENGDGTLTEIQDLIYKDEYIDIQVTYDDTGSRLGCILLTELPMLKIETSMAGVIASLAMPDFDENTKDSYTDLRLGTPFSQMLTWNPTTVDGNGDPVTPHWEYGLIFMVKIGVLDPTNPFYRSIKGVPDDQWTDLIFPVQVPKGSVDANGDPLDLDVVITDYEINKDVNYKFIMRQKATGDLYTSPVGKHFSRFEQKGAWDGTRHTPFMPNTTGEHTHHDGGPINASLGGSEHSPLVWNNTIPPINKSGNMSYETAPTWIGVQGWVYL